jgi:hypothetical protein
VVELHLRTTGLVGGILDGLEHVFLRDDSTAGGGSVGETLGTGDHIGGNVKLDGGKGTAESAEAGDDLVKDQQDVVLVADLSDALQVAHGRREDTSTTSNRLDDLAKVRQTRS